LNESVGMESDRSTLYSDALVKLHACPDPNPVLQGCGLQETDMTTDADHVTRYVRSLLENHTEDELKQRLMPSQDGLPPRLPRYLRASREGLEHCWEILDAPAEVRESLADAATLDNLDRYGRNIENLIGTVKVPVGIAGPLRINGLFAQGDYHIPLATSEAALVASYNRGAQLISEAGGCTSMLLNEGLTRAPGFAFDGLSECGQFVAWAVAQLEEFRRCAENTTRHGKLIDMSVAVEGNHVYLNFEYTTGNASGQNMVTIATQAVCDYILEQTPVRPRYWCVEANLAGDKKASSQSFLQVRGKKVSAEATLSAGLIGRWLHTTPERMVQHWRMSALGGVLSGTIGVQGHYANGLAALYIACGQDAACVSESAVGVTRMETTRNNELYISVTLPNIMVGTVGGGTRLPSQRACLDLLGLSCSDSAQELAEVSAGLCLAGELSTTGALCAGDFSRAHHVLARRRKRK
jgi:hydroxymethylglutaryl-CoA reductase (NADPH)